MSIVLGQSIEDEQAVAVASCVLSFRENYGGRAGCTCNEFAHQSYGVQDYTSTIYFTVWLDLRPFSWRASALVVVELHVAPPRGGRLNAEHGALLVAPARDLVEEHELLHVARGRDPPRQVGLPYTQRKTGSEPVLPVPASTRSKLGVLTIRAGHATFF